MTGRKGDFSLWLPRKRLEEEFEEGGLDPLYYILEYRLKEKVDEILRKGEKEVKYKLASLNELVSRRKEKITGKNDRTIYEIQAKHIDRATGSVKDVNRKSRNEVTLGSPLAKVKDVIFLRMRPYQRKVAIIPEKIRTNKEEIDLRDLPIVCSSEFCVLRERENSLSLSVNSQFFPDYIWAILRSNITLFQLMPLIKGGTRPRVSFSQLLNVKIPVPKNEGMIREIVNAMKNLREKIEEFREIKKNRIKFYKNTLGKKVFSRLGIEEMKSLDEDLVRLLIEGDLLPESYHTDFY